MQNNTLILVCCHKKDYCYDGDGFFPIHVGKAISKVDLGYPGDDTGDNISVKNPNFCELTAHYWLWKNGPKAKYYGLNHYRRYFDFGSNSLLSAPIHNITEEGIKRNPPTLPNLEKIFDKYDIVTAVPLKYPYPLYLHYCAAHSKNDLIVLEETVKELYPEYSYSYDQVMKCNCKFSAYNMFIMPAERFKEYSEWLFNILFTVEQRVTISSDPVQARVFGYMSERLLNVYIHHNKLKVKYVPILKVTDEPNGSRLRIKLASLKNDIAGLLISHTQTVILKK